MVMFPLFPFHLHPDRVMNLAYIEAKQTQGKKSVDTMRNNLDGDVFFITIHWNVWHFIILLDTSIWHTPEKKLFFI